MKQTQLGTWKELIIAVVAVLLLKMQIGVLFGSLILALVVYFAYRKDKVIHNAN